MALIDHLGVAILTNNRNPPLLRFIVRRWLELGAEVAVGGDVAEAEATWPKHRDITLFTCPCDAGAEYGNSVQATVDAVRRPFALITADDIMPLGDEAWRERLPLKPGVVQSIRLVSVTGQRWGDWAYYDGRRICNQRYDERRPGTYITGGSQLLAPDVRKVVGYRGREFHDGCDIFFCYDAEAHGFELRPPVPDGPLLVHFDRWREDPANPEHLHTPLRMLR